MRKYIIIHTIPNVCQISTFSKSHEDFKASKRRRFEPDPLRCIWNGKAPSRFDASSDTGEYVPWILFSWAYSSLRGQPKFETKFWLKFSFGNSSSLLLPESRISAKLASLGLCKGIYGLNQPKENSTGANHAWNEMEREEKKKAICQEITKSWTPLTACRGPHHSMRSWSCCLLGFLSDGSNDQLNFSVG